MVEADPKNLYHELRGPDAGRDRDFQKESSPEVILENDPTEYVTSIQLSGLDEGRGYPSPKTSTE